MSSLFRSFFVYHNLNIVAHKLFFRRKKLWYAWFGRVTRGILRKFIFNKNWFVLKTS
jgi:hypothetical protein